MFLSLLLIVTLIINCRCWSFQFTLSSIPPSQAWACSAKSSISTVCRHTGFDLPKTLARSLSEQEGGHVVRPGCNMNGFSDSFANSQAYAQLVRRFVRRVRYILEAADSGKDTAFFSSTARPNQAGNLDLDPRNGVRSPPDISRTLSYEVRLLYPNMPSPKCAPFLRWLLLYGTLTPQSLSM